MIPPAPLSFQGLNLLHLFEDISETELMRCGEESILFMADNFKGQASLRWMIAHVHHHKQSVSNSAFWISGFPLSV